MHALSMPSTFGELAMLAVIIAGFASFALTLFAFSTSAMLAQAAAERPVERQVTPARPQAAPAAVPEG